jgi:hypothetical protein
MIAIDRRVRAGASVRHPPSDVHEDPEPSTRLAVRGAKRRTPHGLQASTAVRSTANKLVYELHEQKSVFRVSRSDRLDPGPWNRREPTIIS